MNFLNYLASGFLMACAGQAASDDTTQNPASNWIMIVVYIAIFALLIYFLVVRPQRKQKKEAADRNASLEAGDSVLTTSGFYGTVVAINGDTVIVEFGNNKNCRIPMSKQAIAQIEKASAAVATPGASSGSSSEETSSKSSKRRLFGKTNKAEAEEAQARAEAEAAKAAQQVEEVQAPAEEPVAGEDAGNNEEN